ncbi:MAG: ATP-binding protein [Solirubrobacteraceae bacterium]|nr:ATP-binding protein [Solirubrobacteraceae bacterium]
MQTTHHRLATSATPQMLDEVHTLLDAVWHDAPHLGPEERARFTIVTAELVANVCEHGAHGMPAPPWLELDVDVRGSAIHGHLTDDGREPPRGAPGGRKITRAPADAPDPPHEYTKDEIDAIRESGRGLLLIRSASDDLALTRVAGHNRWRYVVRPRRQR